MTTSLSSLAASPTDATALIVEHRTWTYRELNAAAEATAAALHADAMAGERVAIMLSNSPQLVIAYLACFRAGAVAVPLNARYAAPEIEKVLRSAAPKWLLVHRDRVHLLAGINVDGIRVEIVDDTLPTAPRRALPAPDEEAVIFFTSGSTGRPKGVVHSHASALAMLTSTAHAFDGVTEDDTTLVFEPQVHVSGFIGTFTTLLHGGTVALHDGFDAQKYAYALTTQRPTLLCTHIDVLAQTLNVPGVDRDTFRSLRGVYTGGDSVPAALQRQFLETTGLTIAVGYGMTEAIWLTVDRSGRAACIGRPVPDVQLRTDEGEILVNGPMVMQRYWQDDELTEKAFSDGWFHTGDLGRQDDDGVWWFTGRIKDVIVRRTSKITPGEIEAVLDQHPDVAMAAVVAVDDPDEGQVPVAFVVPRQNRTPTADELKDFLRGRIAEYKIPARVHLRAEIPLTASGKLSRRDLHEN